MRSELVEAVGCALALLLVTLSVLTRLCSACIPSRTTPGTTEEVAMMREWAVLHAGSIRPMPTNASSCALTATASPCRAGSGPAHSEP